MISRRNFIVICVMMIVIVFMFQFSQIIKENGNEYETNAYFNKYLESGNLAWKGTVAGSPMDYQSGEYIAYWGDKNSAVTDIVKQWSVYTKNNLYDYGKSENILANPKFLPKMVLIDAASKDILPQMKAVEKLTSYGVPVVFCTLPPYSDVAKSSNLQEMLGISMARMESTSIDGVELFDGLLLGGAITFLPQDTNGKEIEAYDFDESVPWYICGKGTKTYMMGIKDEPSVDREKYPRLIWRNTYNDAMVFGVNGDYMSDLTGLGLLSAFLYECNDYAIYPVVNAQNVSVVEYPSLSNENSEVMEEVYSRNTTAFLRDIVWPNMLSVTLQNKLKLTCFISTKYDYRDSSTLDEGLLTFYLQQMKEVGAEAGRSLRFQGAFSLKTKAGLDQDFYHTADVKYNFGAYYIDELSGEFREMIENEDGVEGIHTITCEDAGKLPLLGYYTDYTTVQGVTHKAQEYSYRKDLEIRGVNTALAYTNMMIDMHNVLWPTEEEHQWQFFVDSVASNIAGYYTKFKKFDQTTLSVSDHRARTLLNMNYKEERVDNVISLDVVQTGSDGWFLLRTHGEKVSNVKNGSFRKIENDVYLIHTEDSHVEIELKKADNVYRYNGPFHIFSK
ncbi:MAG: DUF2194 domain-containing protein [Acetatifactor sp.]|nr:DUF2194 domain-containing protein [Acetatifactor sp.]